MNAATHTFGVHVPSLRFAEYVCRDGAKVLGSGARELRMNWIVLLSVSAFAVLTTSCENSGRHSVASNNDVQRIALDQIWACEMPKARDIRELEPSKFGEHTRSLPSAERFRLLSESMTDRIRVALNKDRPNKGGVT